MTLYLGSVYAGPTDREITRISPHQVRGHPTETETEIGHREEEAQTKGEANTGPFEWSD